MFSIAKTNTEDNFGYGKQYVFLQSGYGAGFAFSFVGSGDGSEVSYLATFPGFAVGISDVLATDSWYRGNFDLLLQAEVIGNFQPVGGYSLGGAFLFRYNFLASKRFVPYVELGLGFGYLNFNLQDQADGFVFSPQGSLGAHYFITDNFAINGAWKVHHMSNSGLEQPNNSINANVFLLGVSYFFK
ncbi:MAG: outer membrane beta-barrel protein [Methyloprofundus sp.]|nr:outer membrane beta-barrel protein [Methyloprofundus sp.]